MSAKLSSPSAKFWRIGKIPANLLLCHFFAEAPYIFAEKFKIMSVIEKTFFFLESEDLLRKNHKTLCGFLHLLKGAVVLGTIIALCFISAISNYEARGEDWKPAFEEAIEPTKEIVQDAKDSVRKGLHEAFPTVFKYSPSAE